MFYCGYLIMLRESKLQKSVFVISKDKPGYTVLTNSPYIWGLKPSFSSCSCYVFITGQMGFDENPAVGAAALWKIDGYRGREKRVAKDTLFLKAAGREWSTSALSISFLGKEVFNHEPHSQCTATWHIWHWKHSMLSKAPGTWRTVMLMSMIFICWPPLEVWTEVVIPQWYYHTTGY